MDDGSGSLIKHVLKGFGVVGIAMTERPNIVLALLLAGGAFSVSVIAVALVAVAQCDVSSAAGNVVAAFSTCIVFFHDIGVMPVAALVSVGLCLLSLLGFGHELMRVWREQRQVAQLAGEADEGALAQLARALGARELHVLPGARPAAFCVGLIRPRVVVTQGLLEELDRDEIAAAIGHEAHHARHFEPLKAVVGRLTVTAFFWLPAFGDLFDRYLLARELAADRAALEATSPAALAGALYVVASVSQPAGAVGLADFASARVDRLFDPVAALPPVFRHRRLLPTLLVVGGLAVVVATHAHVHLTSFERFHHWLTALVWAL